MAGTPAGVRVSSYAFPVVSLGPRSTDRLIALTPPASTNALNQAPFSGYVGLEYWPKDEDRIAALREAGAWLG